MKQVDLLAAALGLAALAGINLYLTVFATGLAIHFHWITLAPAYQSLEVLGNPWVIIVSGILYFLEFLADKIPWVDSIWDAVHTVIRPIGGAFLAIQVLGHPDPVFAVIVGLLAGGTSLASHTAKAATRLTANASPEPFSNIALSFGEDVAVVGGLALIYHNPIVALSIFAIAMGAFLYFAPRILRAMKVKVWLAWKKLNGPADFGVPAKLPIVLPGDLAEIFSKQNLLGETTAWAVPCISGRAGKIPANLFGALVAMNEEPHKLLFVARKGRRPFIRAIDLDGTIIAREPKFLSENLIIAPDSGKGGRYLFLFSRSSANEVEQIVEGLRDRLGRRGPEGVESRLEPQASAAS
jgi:hypothetical protein